MAPAAGVREVPERVAGQAGVYKRVVNECGNQVVAGPADGGASANQGGAARLSLLLTRLRRVEHPGQLEDDLSERLLLEQ